jgi:hypothetical protein
MLGKAHHLSSDAFVEAVNQFHVLNSEPGSYFDGLVSSVVRMSGKI